MDTDHIIGGRKQNIEYVNSSVARFAGNVLFKFLLQFSPFLAAQLLYIVWPAGMGNFYKNVLANLATELLTYPVIELDFIMEHCLLSLLDSPWSANERERRTKT